MYPLSKLKRLAGATLIAASLAGCGAITAQNPSGHYKPVNAVADDPEARLLLKGADVTAYFTQGKFVQGSAQYRSSYEGVDFRFASAQAKSLFDQSPAQYLPQYGGFCANGLVYGIPWGGDANTWKMVNGKLYIFGGQGSLDAFELDEKQNLALADKYWNEEVKGSNSFMQRSKRLLLRVPHYKSGEELAKLVEAAKAKAKP
ncbi:MAG TPA: YHS domain-containing (seleno)protein [Rhodoferax sp.]|nr:YHS domain-containing (seleno)protein [Rhodoferax sp.]